MSEELQNTNNNEREIDLIDLMGRFFNWFGNICKTVFLGILYFLVRNRYWYLAAIVVVIILTSVKSRYAVKYYDCTLVVQTKSVKSSEIINFINNWNYRQSLPKNLLSAVKSINGTYMLDYNKDGVGDEVEKWTGKVVTDTAIINKRLVDIFCVNAQIFIADNDTILDAIRDALLNYLGNDQWVIDQNKKRQNEGKLLLGRIDKEIAMLDSLEQNEYFESNDKYKFDKNGGLMMISEKEKKLYHNDLIGLVYQKNSIERNYYSEPFKVIQNFSLPLQAVNNPYANFTKSFLFVMFLATIIILIIDQRKGLKKLVDESKRN
mgnify:CR=1 FL=1